MVANISTPRSAPAAFPSTERATRAANARREAEHDADLVLRFNQGDAVAFVEIITRYRDKMFHVAYGVLHNRADAEEIAQDTFVRAHRALAKFRGDSSLAAWLYRISLNLARNRYWHSFRRRTHATVSLDCPLREGSQSTFSDLVATEEADPAREAIAGEFTALVAACMKRLNGTQREILELRNTRNRSYHEISVELGISVGTVKSRIGRARDSLRGLLAASCPEFGPGAGPPAWFESVRPGGGVEVICA